MNNLHQFLMIAAVSFMPLLAVDGVVLIDHARAMAGNVTPGDTPGYPVTITAPGSYRLSGNLTVPNAYTSAIELSASHVSIDLNGFSILGSVDCSGAVCVGVVPGLGPTGGSGIHNGTLDPVFNVTIRNGTIQGMSNAAIALEGDSILVESINARSNGYFGIAVHSSADLGPNVVQNCRVERNGYSGISFIHGRITNNVVSTNRNLGIVMYGGGLVSGNVVHRNVSGFFGTSKSVYRANAFFDNGTNIAFAGAVNLGQNLCDSLVCP